MTSDIDIRETDPASSATKTCLTAYFAEIAAAFPNGFDPGPVNAADLQAQCPPLGSFLIAYQGTQPIGCVALRGDGSDLAEVKRLWVAPPARSLGLATRLMSAVEIRARTLGITRLQLDTSRHLPKAVAFYRRLGWAETTRYNDNPYAHHWFERQL
ncbi:GNAT family N-acetyltransferase [Pseudorhodobacter sp.]|uniref:GNAT family N-acetyltransferase n=1 Tax=Pseudorhodobacter sp. TaxID=1934400 RepID=UPI002648509F|nr:GNAT family N-acetyltransferase [Pseudorhodobacter sp.]MDN5789192.1 GNAT family N-acetyltransferase [Pseudorhodobacter sp.]